MNKRPGQEARKAVTRAARNASKKKTAPVMTPETVILSRRRRLAAKADIMAFVFRLAAMAALIWVLFGVVFGITPMGSDDMTPRISAGDLLLYYRLETAWHAQDVIVYEKDGGQYVGRIVAQGGDTVEITEDAEVKINGSIVIENNIYYATPQYDTDITYPIVLDADEVFVLCDYRQGGKDSRYFGAVRLQEVKGKVITVVRRSGL